MTNEQKKQRSDADAELEQEIRKERKFTLAEAIGRMAGPGAMKGTSPILGMQQAASAIETWLRRQLADPDGALQVVLLRAVKESDLLLNNYDQPLVVLGGYCNRVLRSDYLLKELVRETDIEWSRIAGERPRFERDGSSADADDPYTVDSVRRTLSDLHQQLAQTRNSTSDNDS